MKLSSAASERRALLEALKASSLLVSQLVPQQSSFVCERLLVSVYADAAAVALRLRLWEQASAFAGAGLALPAAHLSHAEHVELFKLKRRAGRV